MTPPEEIQSIVDGIWTESYYSFDKQKAVQRLIGLFNRVIQTEPIEDNTLLKLDELIIYTPEQLLKWLANHYQLSAHILKSKSRKGELVKVRRIFCYMSRLLWPYDRTGKMIHQGNHSYISLRRLAWNINRDHSDVSHHLKTMEQEIPKNKELRDEVNGLLGEIDNYKPSVNNEL